eukprot:CAMPEP_0182425070 /NCGR_PEP_ID=MMETSP1167-20130531/11404_1 /TAXON_ID=2988 /ORGANISM="Mallomonas Sp, Strain CCMP3275" /LENGTH=118 /DNA_ID=CAMNT_0024605409 /DNA_START=102 /DNA_END=454 /DNA_ORIENTATION=-
MVAEVILYADYHETDNNKEMNIDETGHSRSPVNPPEADSIDIKNQYENIVYGFNDCARETGLALSFLVNGCIMEYLNSTVEESPAFIDSQFGTRISFSVAPVLIAFIMLFIQMWYPHV